MGQAKLKLARKPEKKARAGTVRLQGVEIKGHFVGYDERGRATKQGTGATEAFFLMEAEIPAEIVAAIRKQFPNLEFTSIDPEAADDTAG